MSAAPTRLIQLAPEIHERYQAYFRSVFDQGPLDERSRAVVAVTAALTIGNQGAVQTFATVAKQAGMTNEDLGHIAALVELVRLETPQRAAAAEAAPARPAAKSCC
jgi:alkylhydroperoxidase/carboxymuconolactone decarboxylase family protein YurZ